MYVKSSRELYGWDRLSKVTLIVGIFLIITRYAWILGTALIIYSIWRSKSTNLRGRNIEKFVFENIERRFFLKITNFRQDFKESVKVINNKIKNYNPIEKLKENRKYIITNCPKCKQKLRVPRKKGKIIVTCSKCFSEFRLKT
ncbi:hypothetical protein [Clostridium lacusfryxellense]|uniref:hypothetical protein n=1 Tax=Clostridium lacusfryxellense TaxID=205328 RepID=UPI001C0B247B|nr:hypothetical protein [Clostridium lacusfryxellense]MBU3112054.1 hypothetical protein [Clostridium lacusfryxellense]